MSDPRIMRGWHKPFQNQEPNVNVKVNEDKNIYQTCKTIQQPSNANETKQAEIFTNKSAAGSKTS